MDSSSALRSRITDRSAHIAILGLGSVGLPLAAAFVRAGFRVLGFDIDRSKIERLLAGETYLSHLDGDVMEVLGQRDRFDATDDAARLGETDVKIICVPTPLGEYREPDLSYIEGAAEVIAATLADGDLVVLESTTYPSTTRTVVGPILERGGKHVGRDFFLAFSPEREDPGRKDFDPTTIPKLVGVVDEGSGELAR